MTTSQPIIKMSGICFAYSETSPILKDLDFKFFKGEKVGLIAPNGSGKNNAVSSDDGIA